MGQNPFTTIPRWYINGVSLDIEDKLNYLGSILGENGGKEQHIVTFWVPGFRNFMYPGVNPQTALHLFNVGVSSTLTYGCASICKLKILLDLDVNLIEKQHYSKIC